MRLPLAQLSHSVIPNEVFGSDNHLAVFHSGPEHGDRRNLRQVRRFDDEVQVRGFQRDRALHANARDDVGTLAAPGHAS
jgi:hypothetical protein